MPFIPHTPEDERLMLAAIGAPAIDDLFAEIPASLRAGELQKVPTSISEMALLRLMAARAEQDRVGLSFLGAGAYEHHIPAAVWELASRGEFMTAYTPYQAEASQGILQLIYEFQTMMTRLMAMDIANASVYDGASAMAEAVLMAVRANKQNRSRQVAICGDVHPAYVNATRSIVSGQGIDLTTLPFDEATGRVTPESLQAAGEMTALVISYPSFFGGLADVHQLTDWAHQHKALVIAVVNPTAMAVLTPPGQWGAKGADIAVGEGQPLGIPLSSGGPYLGFMCCRKEIVRQMPGRIIGRTVDAQGKDGFVLTLQAREQHIRRGKATSNICTNQGLLVTAATIYLSLLGDEGLRSVAFKSAAGLAALVQKATQLKGVTERFVGPRFHETVLSLPMPASEALRIMAAQGVLGGLDLGAYWPQKSHCLLVNVTETKTQADLDAYVDALAKAIESQS